MDLDQVWMAIEVERLSLADFAQELSQTQWEQPSLCEGWTVRHVIAHVAMAPRMSLGTSLTETIKAKGSINRMIHNTALREAARPTADIVADLRAHAATRKTPPGANAMISLIDLLVHGQDVALPLGTQRDMPVEAATAAADRVWTLHFPFHARKKFHGLRFTATDTTWSVGDGATVQGQVGPLLLALTGRSAALDQLSGDGVPELTKRLTTAS